MKLLTHNVLTSKCIKGVKVGYPLKLTATQIKVVNVDFNGDFLSKMIPKLDWPALYATAVAIGHAQNLPSELPENYETNEEFLKSAHHCVMEVDVIEGEMACPETGRVFPIKDGIPNMLLNEDEV